ncbi:MAG: hypothetical protein U9P12_01315 [Verrucomicrobiota bacterium]|nr:hypothetical protein [Verrucomicrobiota bacterium]
MRPLRLTAILLAGTVAAGAQAGKDLPVGLMLNLDFEEAKEGLIPSKALYPLYVPQGDLGIEWFNNRNLLAFQQGQGLDIPHSSLLNPDGREWIVTVRAFVLTDGLILSQGNDTHGYAIYLVDNTVRATLRSGNTALTLKERKDRGISKYRKKWVSIELRIKQDKAYLSLNRKRIAVIPLDTPLQGENMHIRLGNHQTLPPVLAGKPGMEPTGFTGAISSLKIIRQ